MAKVASLMAIALLCWTFVTGCARPPQQDPTPSGLAYDAQIRGPVPIPASERDLQTVEATSWLKVSDEGIVLEGAAFDRSGNLFLCDVTNRRVLRVTRDQKLSIVIQLDEFSPGGLAFGKDGRLFIAAMDSSFNTGAIMAMEPDGSGLSMVVPPSAGFLPNDLAFDADGGFYFTDFRGRAAEPRGGVFYAAPGFSTIRPVLSQLAMANGVALSPDGKQLWATEFGRNLLHRVDLADAASPAPLGSSIPYRFIGPAPDSMRADADGNVYVAMYTQGRVLVMNENGIPIGQVLLPGREDGHDLLSTSMAIRPGTNDLYILTSDGGGGQGATIYHTRSFAPSI